VSRSSFLTALIGDEEYAVPLVRVHEVLSLASLTRVPTAPPFIRGLVDVHGAAVPVVDLSRRFGAAPGTGNGNQSVVVVETKIRGAATLAGILIDRLGRVRHVPMADIQPPSPLESLVSVEFLTGVFLGEGGYVLCVDVDRILGADEAAQVAELSRHLARDAEATPKAVRRPYLRVRLAGERCALALAPLREINPCGTIASIPGAAGFVLGATNVRGAIVPVVDVARRYGLGSTATGSDAALILVDVGVERTTVGMLVDAIEGLSQLAEGDLNTTPPFGVRFPPDVVLAMAPVPEGFVPVLDTDRILTENAETAAAPGGGLESSAA
jgi:purine-binding chemotaxis protein CheW